MVFTAVLAAIAVIAAMVTVPGADAQDSNGPVKITANNTYGSEESKGEEGTKTGGFDHSWGTVWAGNPENTEGSNAGWGWCIDTDELIPKASGHRYNLSEAGKAPIPDEYYDAAINVAVHMREAYLNGDRDAAFNDSMYLAALIGFGQNPGFSTRVIKYLVKDEASGVIPSRFTGSEEEFTKLTGLRIVNPIDAKFERVESVDIPHYDKGYYITVVGPDGDIVGNKNGAYKGQRVFTPDQPGLPDNPDNGGGSEQPTTPNETTTEESTSENPEGETSSSETTTESEPSNTEETTPKDSTTEPTSPEETTTEDTGEPTPGKTTDVVPNPDPTPTTEEQEKDLNPEIKTEAKIKDGDRVEKGATVIDTVTYKDLVPGKKYTLKAKLISKKDGETVLGEGSAVLVPEESAGEQDVEITVNDKADPAVDAAVAFEKLVSTEVDKDGNETSGSTDENVIATHENINDEKQTVNTKWTPSIKTNADFANAKQVKAGVTVKDTVTYTDLVPGKEYTLKAELRNKAVNAKGDHEVVGKGDVTFTPEKSAGEQVVDIKVNDDVEGVIKAAVAFEDLYSKQVDENGKETPNSDEEKKITEHRDINDQAQTVTSHKNAIVSTNADFENGSKEVVAGAKIVDQVSYEGLVPGKEYSLDAQLISKKDGKTVLGETKGHTFTPKSANGTEAVTITVNDDVTEPVEAAVAFETLTSKVVNDKGEDTPDNDKPNEIGEHKDIDDEDQTVTSEGSEKTPKITTNADFEKGSHEVIAGAKIVDDVTYEGLVPGKEYTLKAELISKKDGKSVLGTGEKTFTPEKSHGMVPVTITVNDDVKEPVQAAVAFEELTSTEVNDKGEETPGTTPEKPNHIAEHKDINDEDQTVTSHEVHDQDKPGGSSDGSSNGSSNGSSDGSSNGSSKDNKWWLILIPGIGLGKIIKDHFDHKDHGNHNGGHGDNTSSHNGGHGDNTGNHNGGNGHEDKGQDAPKGGNSDNGNGRGVEVQGQQPEETGNALPSNADRVEIKSVPSGATELELGMQDYIK